MAAVISVERFSIVLAAGTTSNSATLTKSQTVANCIPFLTKRITTKASPQDDPSEQCVDVAFSGSTVVVSTFNNTPRAMVCEVTVVEFDPDNVTVQQGTYDNLTSEKTSSAETITAVVLANSFLVHAWKSETTNHLQERSLLRGTFESTTALRFDRGASNGVITGHWFVAEADNSDFTVDPIEIIVTGTSDTATIGAVTENKTFLVGSYEVTTGASDDNADGSIDITLTNSTTVTVQRAASGGTITWSGFAIEFAGGGGENVQRNTITAQGATASQNVSITTVADLALSMVHTAGAGQSFKHGSFPGSGSDDCADAQLAWDFVDASTIRVQHSTSGNEANNDFSWEVIEWAAAGGAQTDKTINFGMVTGMDLTKFPIRPKTVNFGMVTGMVTTPVPTFVRNFNVTFATAMALVKQTQKTFSVGFPMAVAITKETRVSKAIGFTTTMTLALAQFFVKPIAFTMTTAMTISKVISKALSVAFVTAMSVVKETRRTFSVGFTTAFALTKTTKVVKAVSFATSMAFTRVLQLSQAISFATITSMVVTAVRFIPKAITVAFVTAMSTTTNFIAGTGIFPLGIRAYYLRRRHERGRKL